MDKPKAGRLGWRLRHIRHPFANRFMRVRQDALTTPGGATLSYSYVELNPVVIVVPVTVEGDIVLIRQFRYTIDEWVWEVPAGGSHDFTGDDLEALARRELREEVGGEPETVTWMGVFNPMVGKADVDFHIYLATGVTLGASAPEPGEQIEIHRRPIAEALRMARDGRIYSGASGYALLRCEPELQALAAGS